MPLPRTPILRWSLLLVGALACGGRHARQLPDAATVRSTVDSLARVFIKAKESPGVSIEVVRGSDTLVSHGWGMADLDEKVPASASTLYRVGSITKQFTASAVMREVENGKLSLGDSIGRYLPALPARWRPATVRELLNHTSGIPSYTDIGERWQRRWREDVPPDSLVALTAHDALWFAPGSNWRYDNSGYVVLGMLLSKLEGKPYPQFIEESLLRPLGLQHTYYCDLDRVLPGRAPGYTHTSGTFQHAARLSMTQPYAAGALCSTVGDLAHWNVLLATGRVVKPESYRAMTTPMGAAEAHHYGFGLTSTSLEGHREIEHAGGIMGFVSDNAYFPDDSLSVTVLTNADGSHPGQLLLSVARTALGLPLTLQPRVSLSDAQRRVYAGHYVIHLPGSRSLPISIRVSGDSLVAQAEGQGSFELVPQGHNSFGATFDPTLRMTFTVEDGHATGFTLEQQGIAMKANRVGDQSIR